MDVHYTASSPSATVQAIAAYQTGPGAQEAFPAIAYTLMVDGAGAVFLCHDLAVRCWHNGAPGANTTRVGVCWIGNGTPTQVQIDGLAQAIRYVERTLGRPMDIRGHGDVYQTTCPGPTWDTWRSLLVQKVRNL